MKTTSPVRGGRIPPGDPPVLPPHRPRSSSKPLKENVEPAPEATPLNRCPSSKKRSPLPPRPPSCTPLKRKLTVESITDNATSQSDSEVKVILRVRPPAEGEEEGSYAVQKISSDSVLFQGHTYTFDSVADVGSTQEDIYKLVGLPLVENCLAGFNSSIFAYGQTGSGKTYTMWGPVAALNEDSTLNAEKGLAPRVFEHLFDRMKEEQIKHTGKQLNYQCRCSFLEIYNEQITDLLDLSQKNLLIREDVRAGIYVEKLTEHFVCSRKEVTKLLIKGLENRRTCATSMNTESSRSHCVFTCIIECRSKCMPDGLSSLRTSRINLVDLAGSERQKQTGAAGERLKEAGNINRSLCHLGKLINILGEISQSGKQRHIPYRDSKLTFLLQDSLGGNAKMAMICAISPSPSCMAETLGTLGFAQRAKDVKNKAVVNEVTEDDANFLREQIRQLKDELLRMKAGSDGGSGSFSTGWNARRSLHLLRQSLNRPMNYLPVDDDNDEEMEIDEEDVEKSNIQTGSGTACSKKVCDGFEKTQAPLEGLHPASHGSSFSCSTPTEHLAASLHHGNQIFDLHQKKSPSKSKLSPFRASVKLVEDKLLLPQACKVDFGMQTISQESEEFEEVLPYVCSYCKNKAPPLEYNDVSVDTNLQLVPISSYTAEKSTKQVPKVVERVLAAAIRREMLLEEHCAKQAAEIAHISRLVQQYKHERECNVIIERTREDKISRLEGLMEGIVPIEHYMDEDFSSLANEYKILLEKYENHPEVLRVNIELKRVQDELQSYKNFCDLGERDILMEEIQDLRHQLQSYIDTSSGQHQNQIPALQLTYVNESSAAPQEASELVKDCSQMKFEEERCRWNETESRLVSLSEELRLELDSMRSLADRQKVELDSERRCMEELKEALQSAMQGHARMLEQYVELEERYIQLRARHTKFRDAVVDVKKATSKAGARVAESKYNDCLAGEISILKAEREKERRYWKEQNKALQCQLNDTAEAVQAAGELLVRLKEAEEAVEQAQKRNLEVEKEAMRAKQELENLKLKYEIASMNQYLSESRPHKEDALEERTVGDAAEAKYDNSVSLSDNQWNMEYEPFQQEEGNDFSKGAEHYSWFSDYDRCNM